jgi:hypothetical protein
MGRRIPPPMLKYLYRTCPKCKDYLGVVVRDPPEPKKEVPIDAHCVVCGFKLGWKVVLGKKFSLRSASTALSCSPSLLSLT